MGRQCTCLLCNLNSLNDFIKRHIGLKGERHRSTVKREQVETHFQYCVSVLVSTTLINSVNKCYKVQRC